MTSNRFLLTFVLLLSLLTVSGPAFAYLDPSTGSMIMSAIIGVFATLLIAAKAYWYRLKRFFGGGRSKRASAEDDGVREDARQD